MFAAACEIIATLLDVVFMVWFIPQYFGRRFWEKPWTLTIAGIMLAFQLIADRFMVGYDALYIIGVLVLVYGYTVMLSSKQFMKSLFATCLFLAIQILSGSILHAVFNLLVEDASLLAIRAGTKERVLLLLVGKLVQYASCQFALRFFNSKGELSFRYNLLFFLHTVLTVAGLGVLIPLSYYAKNDSLAILLTTGVLLALNVVIYYMVYQLMRLQRNKYELALLREKMEFEKLRAKEVGAIWDDVRKTRHDLKNHLTVMREQLRQGNTEDCVRYVNELLPVVKSKGKLHVSGNAMLDYLINSKLQELKDTEILISGLMNNQPKMDDADLVCMLGHILNDAIETLAEIFENKRIEIHFFTKKNVCMIVCKYTVGEHAGHIKKREAQKSGQLTDFLVEKYGGMTDRFYKNDMFCVQIVLPRNETKTE